MYTSVLLSSLLALAGIASAGPVHQPVKRAACSGNTADDRSTWCDYSLSTNFYDEVPDTGVTREYWLSAETTNLALDGVDRFVMAFNGTIPGPTIFADWGDTVTVHVTNNMASSLNNGTSIHFHGIRQNYTNSMDGVVSVTQCPLAPGDTETYTWRATQYGTSWYHSHFTVQAWEGLYGGIQIEGPTSANYDEDKGLLFLTDWTHQPVDSLFDYAETHGAVPVQNGLINGTNVYGDDGASNQTGTRFSTTFESGKSYRFRIVNTAIDTLFKFSIDNHTMTVVSSDLVPIKSYTTKVLSVAIAQRYDIIVTADQASTASNFWIRAEPAISCSSTNDMQTNIRGIVSYDTTASTPTTSPQSGWNATDCLDESTSNLAPYLSLDASSAFYTNDEDVTIANGTPARWLINGNTFQGEWGNPTLLQIADNTTNFNSSMNVLEASDADEWVYLIIENGTPLPHPIHLHGHDFYLLGQSAASEDYSSSVSLNLDNPPRRDVAMVQADGYLVLAFKTDNPGAWLVHCHIGWHVAEGLALQYVERSSEITNSTVGLSETQMSQCSAWNSYATANAVVDDDSGV